MANIGQMMSVGNSCYGYDPVGEGFSSSIGASNSKSCSNCRHFVKDKCDIDLFDPVLTSLDQT